MAERERSDGQTSVGDDRRGRAMAVRLGVRGALVADDVIKRHRTLGLDHSY